MLTLTVSNAFLAETDGHLRNVSGVSTAETGSKFMFVVSRRSICLISQLRRGSVSRVFLAETDGFIKQARAHRFGRQYGRDGVEAHVSSES